MTVLAGLPILCRASLSLNGVLFDFWKLIRRHYARRVFKARLKARKETDSVIREAFDYMDQE